VPAGPDGCVLGGPVGCVLVGLGGCVVPGGPVGVGLPAGLDGGVLGGWADDGSPGCADELPGAGLSTAAQYAATSSLPPAAVISTAYAGSSSAVARLAPRVASMAMHRLRTFAGGVALGWADVLGQALGEPPVLVKSPPGEDPDAPAVVSAGSRAPWSLPNEPRPGMCPVPAANAAPPPTAINATAAFAVASLAIATATIERFRVARPGERWAPRTASTR
jgi:hypothetical protein